MNGVGERTGNANLITVMANLQLKLGHKVVSDEQLRRLTDTAHFADELLNRQPEAAQPYVGKHAFAHKAGLHAAGIRADATTFEHIDPELVGNRRDLLISELSGKGTVTDKAERAGIELDDAATARVLERMKALEHDGYQFEAADGSFELLLRKESGDYQPLFRLESWRVIVEQRADGRVETEATIKIWVDGERYVSVAEGNGPVNALDAALRAAITTTHPQLADIWLANFKVRILDETKGSDATIRVLIDATDGDLTWGSIGVSTNLIGA
jgi:2-isopropylmalate synthase